MLTTGSVRSRGGDRDDALAASPAPRAAQPALGIGLFVFSIPTLAYDQVQRRAEWRHSRNPRIGARDAAQYVGPGDETVSFSGTTFSEISDGTVSLDELRDMADQGEAWQLVAGDGRVYGSFVIVGLDERHTAFWPDGSARAIDFAIDLLRVDDPSLGAS